MRTVQEMPRVSNFYGIVISMYWRERDHPVPHFHAEYGGRRASVSADGRLLAGALPPRAERLVLEWAEAYRDEILANWRLARNHEPLQPIEPLA